MPTAFLCDFDGTIAPTDIGAALIRRFAPGHEAQRESMLARWVRDEIGSRELTLAECEPVRVTADEALAFTRAFRIDPQFEPFAREALGRGDAVMVVSDGFDFYIQDQLDRAGLSMLPRAANRARFADGRLEPEFPFTDGGCGRCGNCKAQHVRRYRALGFHTVMVGDGLSDRCGARAADAIVARGALLSWCRRSELRAQWFESFADVSDLARRVAAPAPPAGS
jgi:2-hydroxy-3-keto-5-methylthiopentenyl-1-phosphate phosphatase